MTSIEQIKSGLTRYAEEKIVGSVDGLQKVVLGVGIAMYLERLEAILGDINKHPLVSGLGIVDGGRVDTDRLYNHLRTQIEKTGPVSFDVPMIGRFKMGRADVDDIFRYIAGG